MVLTLTREGLIEGQVLLFDKPLNWSSFQLVNKVRYILCKKFEIKKLKVGHAGTLDPLATGLMILCTGRATKQIESLMGTEKEYIADVFFGATTPSYDAETEIDTTYPVQHITQPLIQEKLTAFTGNIKQLPPMFSAKKVNGVRAYKLAREGSENILVEKEVTIHELELQKIDLPHIQLKVNCSKGTYIRSLAHDLGKAMDSGAYLTGLKRTKIGTYNNSDAWDLTNFENNLKSL